MSSISHRFMKAAAVWMVFGAALLAGCSVTTSGAAPGGTASYAVCSGGHASRFPSREENGRVCRPYSSLRAVY
jgi:hypothetical protein